MKKLFLFLLIIFLIPTLVFAQAMGENLKKMVKESNLDYSMFPQLPITVNNS